MSAQHRSSRVWRGVLREYADRLGVSDADTVLTLGEGGTPLLPAPALSARTGAEVFVKVEGGNPTGTFKDRGMVVAISRAAARGARAVICASTGNTAPSAAAYAARAGITAAILVPAGRLALGRISQPLALGARLIQVRGSVDDCLHIARAISESAPVHLVNSVNPDRIDGQMTAAYEIVEQLGDAPDIHILPVGNGGNYTAYARGYRAEHDRGAAATLPRMLGFQAAGAAPLVRGEIVREPQTIASAVRIGNPASWASALEARDDTDGMFGEVTDSQILAAQRLLSTTTGVFVEPASAVGVAGLLERASAGAIGAGTRVVLTVTGHGLIDPQWALRDENGTEMTPTIVEADTAEVAAVLGVKDDA